jgi:hypothetical protein
MSGDISVIGVLEHKAGNFNNIKEETTIFPLIEDKILNFYQSAKTPYFCHLPLGKLKNFSILPVHVQTPHPTA